MQYHDSFLPPVNTLPCFESCIIELTLEQKKKNNSERWLPRLKFFDIAIPYTTELIVCCSKKLSTPPLGKMSFASFMVYNSMCLDEKSDIKAAINSKFEIL